MPDGLRRPRFGSLYEHGGFYIWEKGVRRPMVIMQLPRGRGMTVKCVLRFHPSCLTSAGARCQLMGRAVEKEVSKRGKLHASRVPPSQSRLLPAGGPGTVPVVLCRPGLAARDRLQSVLQLNTVYKQASLRSSRLPDGDHLSRTFNTHRWQQEGVARHPAACIPLHTSRCPTTLGDTGQCHGLSE